MIKHKPYKYDDDEEEYTGPERRKIITEIIESPKKEYNWPQIISFILGIIGSSFTVYINIHDEQIKLSKDLEYFIKRYKEDNDRHNIVHESIFKQVDELSRNVSSLEDTTTAILRNKK